MSTTRKKLVAQAQKWMGAKEGGTTHKQIVDIYNGHKPLARGYKAKYTSAWCALFVSSCAIETNATDIIPTEVSCHYMINGFKKKGTFVESDSYKPQIGDIIFYSWSDDGKGDNKTSPSHVGIVETVNGSSFTVIEGNIDNKVGRRNMKVNGRYIRGYGVPKYADEETPTPTPKPTPQPTETDDKKKEPTADKPLQVGDKVKIVANGKSTVFGGRNTNCVGMVRYITKIHKVGSYRYQVGNKGKTNGANTTGFFKESALKKQ